MARLYVYTTEGTCIYPANGSDDPSINRYFESVNFVADLQDASNPSIEAYFRAVLPSGRPEQLFLRFQGGNRESVFEACRDAVLAELVEERGWEIQQTDSSGDPSMLFQRAVLNPAADPSQVLQGTPLAGRTDLLRAAVHGTNQQLSLTGRNYQAIADAIRTFDDEPVTMAVTDGGVSLSQSGLFFEQKTQQHDIGLPRDTERVLEQVANQRQEAREEMATPEPERIESEVAAIGTKLEEIKQKDVSASTVRQQLDNTLSEVYPSLSVSSGQEQRSPLSVGRSTDESDSETPGLGETATPPPSGGPSASIRSRLPGGTALGAIALVAVLLLVGAVAFGAMSLGDTGGNGTPDRGTSDESSGNSETSDEDRNDGSGANDSNGANDSMSDENTGTDTGSSEFKITNIETNTPVTQGGQLMINVSVENTGNAADSETLSVNADELGSKDRKVDIAAGESNTTVFEFSTENVSAGNYPVTANISTKNSSTDVMVEPQDQVRFDLSKASKSGTTVYYNVTNNGSERGEREIRRYIPGTDTESTIQIALDPGETVTPPDDGTQWSFDEPNSDSYTIRIETKSDSIKWEVEP